MHMVTAEYSALHTVQTLTVPDLTCFYLFESRVRLDCARTPKHYTVRSECWKVYYYEYFVGLSVFCQIIHFPWTPSWTFFSIKMWILWWSKSWCSFLDQMFRPWVWVSSRQLEQVLLQKSWHKWLLFLNIRNMEFLCRPTTRRNSFTCVTPDAPSFLLFHCSNMREVMNCSIFLPMTPKSIS